jgi:hypothetical protein
VLFVPRSMQNTQIPRDHHVELLNVQPYCRVRLKCDGRGNWRMEWIVSTLHTASEHGVSSITTADAHTSAASSRLN